MFQEYIQIEETTAPVLWNMRHTAEKKKNRLCSRSARQEPSMSASDSELALLAAIIQCEAGGEKACRKSCRRRLYEPGKKQSVSSITEVVYQSGQFLR